MVLALSALPTDRVIWIAGLRPDDIARAVAASSSDAPAIIFPRIAGSWSQSTTVISSLDELEALAGQLFPAWLPAATGITTSAGAALAAVRTLAITHAADTDHYGPFLADLAAGALTGSAAYTRRHPPEVRAIGLARVLAASFGRPTCALLLRPPDDLDEGGAQALVGAAQWLVDHGRLGVWICSGSPPIVDCPVEVMTAPTRHTEVVSAEPATVLDASWPVSASQTPPSPLTVAGRPHPASRVEVRLEAALASRPWAAGRAWNHTIRPGPLVNPVRVDLLWQRERCIVEIDGDDHRSAGKFAEDRQRDVLLQLNGYAVLRFTNTQVLNDLEHVLALLQQFLASRRAGKGN